MAFWQAKNKQLVTGQTTDRTPAGRTCKDDGGAQTGGVQAYELLTTGQFSGTTVITVNAKTDTHTNNCVVDKKTGLMWMDRVSASVGPASNGKLYWDDTGGSDEDIFEYCDQANIAGLAGFSDWRVCNHTELWTIANMEAADATPNTSYFQAFPVGATDYIWTNTTQPNNILNAKIINFGNSISSADNKTTATYYLLLVRS